MKTSRRSILGIGAIALVASHCGGSSLDAQNLCEGTASHEGAPRVPSEHRAMPAACSLSQGGPATADGGAISCSSNADCQAGSSLIDPPSCLGKQCRWDQCLVDSDCPSGNVCLCAADAGGGDSVHHNVCVPANCRIDSDCGANEYCSPSRGYCGGVSGFYCHSSRDTCVDVTTDCACGGNACVYAPTVGYFVCGTLVCMG